MFSAYLIIKESAYNSFIDSQASKERWGGKNYKNMVKLSARKSPLKYGTQKFYLVAIQLKFKSIDHFNACITDSKLDKYMILTKNQAKYLGSNRSEIPQKIKTAIAANNTQLTTTQQQNTFDCFVYQNIDYEFSSTTKRIIETN